MNGFNEVVLKNVAKEYGTPIYVYLQEVIEEKAKQLINFLQGTNISYHMHYSTKANGNLELLKIMRNAGLYIDAMTPLELAIVEKAGFQKEEIFYVCNNSTQKEFLEIADRVSCVCLDSVSQIELFGQVCPNHDIMIRINPGIKGVGHSKEVITAGDETKFGIQEQDIAEAVRIAGKYQLNIVGAHQHLGSAFLDDQIDQYIAGAEAGLTIMKRIKGLKIIDLGGGFGVPYKKEEQNLNLSLLKKKLVPILESFQREYGKVTFSFEPGRILVAESCVLLAEVTSIKENRGLNYVGVNAGMPLLIRPAMYEAYHEIEVIKKEGKREETGTFLAHLAGNVCESTDILAENRAFPKDMLLGDLVAIRNAGAYGYAMSSNYTGVLRPKEVLIRTDGSMQVIRKEDTIEEIMSKMLV